MRHNRLVIAFAFVVLPVAAEAQMSADTLLHAGQWGAEAAVSRIGSEAALLRFHSPTLAWRVGASFDVTHSSTDTDITNFPSIDGTNTAITALLGLRSYRHSVSDHLRPVIGGGLLGNYRSAPAGVRTWAAGLYAEAGAVYFVVPHVSLGAIGELDAVTGKQTQNVGVSKVKATSTSISGTLARLVLTAYF